MCRLDFFLVVIFSIIGRSFACYGPPTALEARAFALLAKGFFFPHGKQNEIRRLGAIDQELSTITDRFSPPESRGAAFCNLLDVSTSHGAKTSFLRPEIFSKALLCTRSTNILLTLSSKRALILYPRSHLHSHPRSHSGGAFVLRRAKSCPELTRLGFGERMDRSDSKSRRHGQLGAHSPFVDALDCNSASSSSRAAVAAVRGGGDNLADNSASTAASEVLVDMEYEPPRPQDRVLASAIGLLAALGPLLAHGLVTSTGTAKPPSGSLVALREAAWAIVRLLVGSWCGAFFIKEVRQATRLVDVREAAYSDSRFVLVNGLMVHYFEATPSVLQSLDSRTIAGNATVTAGGADASSAEPPPLTIVIVHGFGSSAAACRAVMRPLADRLGARVLAVDMPGFGLTERPRRAADFDAERMLEGLVGALSLTAGGRRLVLVGHSLGGLVSAKFTAKAGSPAAAAVLVAPAIPAPPTAGKDKPAGAAGDEIRFGARLARAATVTGRVMSAAALFAVQAAVGLLTPAVTAALRFIVYSRAFWVRGIGSAYFDPAQLATATVDDYRRASRVRGWDAGLVRFIRFRATGGRGLWETIRRALRPPEGVPAQLVAAGRPVLVIHGEGDRIIGVGNSRALSRAVEAQYVEIPRCGHCPLEETPAAVVDAIVGFVAAL